MRATRTLARRFPDGVRIIDGYPVPAGGSGDGDGGGSDGGTDGDGGTEGEGEGGGSDGTGTGSETDGTDTGESSTDEGEDGDVPAGSKDALKADLARERKRRQEAERKLADAERENESEAERREREAREAAQAPAIRALRSTAVETAARDAGFLYPGDAFALLTSDERESVEVELEGDEPVIDRDAAAKAVKALAKRRPGLIRSKDGGDEGGSGGSDHQAGGGSNGSSSSSDPNATLRELFRKRTTRLSG